MKFSAIVRVMLILYFGQRLFSGVVCFNLLFRMYIKHGSPVKMMEAYITVLTKGICQSDENGSFFIKDYDVRKAYLAGSVKGKTSQPWRGTLISIFGHYGQWIYCPIRAQTIR